MKKQIAVIGFGITGQSVCEYFKNEESKISVFDSKNQSDFDSQLLDKFNYVEFNFATNDFVEDKFDLIVVSPGVPLTIPVLKRAKEKNIPLHTDITLFIEKWRNVGQIVGVTGSNGKTTIVNLIYKYLKDIGAPVILAGNVGNSPLDDLGKEHQKGTIAVLELSSYQLEYFDSKHYLDVALISNIGSNHLDRYEGSMQKYALAKMKGIDNQKTKVVICADDVGTKNHVIPNLKAKNVCLVSLETSVDQSISDGVYSDDNGDLILKNNNSITKVFDCVDDRKLIGLHNLYNIAMVFGVLGYLNVDLTRDDLIRNFEGLEHRIEFVREINGVKYINDSKSSNPDSTRVAIEAVTKTQNVVLIIGGNDKGMDYHSLNPYIEQYVKKVFLLPGSAEEKIKKTFAKTNVEVITTKNLDEAISSSLKFTENGDVVLLSPAATSFSAYKNYEERGEHFKELVSKI